MLLATATRRFWLQFVGAGGLIRWLVSAVLGTGCAIVSHWQWLIPFVAAISLATPAIYLPTALMDHATKSFIIAQASKHGAKVT